MNKSCPPCNGNCEQGDACPYIASANRPHFLDVRPLHGMQISGAILAAAFVLGWILWTACGVEVVRMRKSPKRNLAEAFSWYVFNVEHDGWKTDVSASWPDGLWLSALDSLTIDTLVRPVTITAQSAVKVIGARSDRGKWSLLVEELHP